MTQQEEQDIYIHVIVFTSGKRRLEISGALPLFRNFMEAVNSPHQEVVLRTWSKPETNSAFTLKTHKGDTPHDKGKCA